jgi:WD40 repeat protein
MLRIRRPTSSGIVAFRTATALLLFALVIEGCGGGSSNNSGGNGGGGGGGGQTPDFTLSANPSSVSIPVGMTSSTMVTATPINGFSSTVSVEVSGLPSGVTAMPASFELIPGSPETVELSAAANAPVTSVTAMFTSNFNGTNHTANLGVAVTATAPPPPPLSTRTKYVRTDAVAEYSLSLNSHWEVYHSPTSRLFVTDPGTNRVIVMDDAHETQIASISVPGAYSIDETPDQSALYVATLIGDIYTIDPTAMEVTQRYLASQIGPYGYPSSVALPLFNGNVALLAEPGGIPDVDGAPNFAIWNPAANSIQIYGPGFGGGGGATHETTVCGPMENIGGFTVAANRTKIILASIDSDSTLCDVDAATGNYTYITGPDEFLGELFTSPDGSYVAVPGSNGVVIYDGTTLAQLYDFAIAGGPFGGDVFVFSADSKTMYESGAGTVFAYNVSTGQELGWIPDIYVSPTGSGTVEGTLGTPNYEFIDSSGLLSGPLEEGVGFLDTTQIRTGPLGTQFTNGYLTPATGAVAGGTPVQLPDPNAFGLLSAMYFGSQPATNLSGIPGIISATTPAGSAGPVPVYTFTADGGMQVLADGFSYGPSILEVTPNESTAEGGGTGVIYGYGFGPTNATAIPSNLSVTVGGAPAKIVGFVPNAYNTIAPPFPLQSVSYTILQGSAGSSADVAVTSSSGTTVSHGGLSYLPATQQFPLPGAALAQGVYDSVHDLYYFTDATKIQVFSLAQHEWLSPIAINGAERLWGIALSPDGSKLAVSDIQADAIDLIDPTNTSSVKTFPFAPPTPLPQGVIDHPAGIAISDAGIAYLTIWAEGGSGYSAFFKMDTNTGIVTDYHLNGPDLYSDGAPEDVYLRTEISLDNSRVFFNADGGIFSIDTATDAIFNATAEPGCCYGGYDLALSENQTQFGASGYLYDTNLNAESYLTLNDREIESAEYVYGTKFSPDGTLFFQPSTNGIDVFDGRLGILLDRIALPFALSENYDALVEDGEDNVLLAITGTDGDGVAVVDLTSLNEPAPLPYSDARRAHVTDTKDINQSSMGKSSPGHGPRAVPHITHSIPLLGH